MTVATDAAVVGPPFSLAGRVVLVSGAGPGLGAVTGRTLVRLGASVVLADLDGEAAARSAQGLADHALAVRCDIRSDDDCRSLMETTLARFGRLDGVVNVAALDTTVGGVLGGAVRSWPEVAAVNVEGTLRVIEHAAPALAASGRGAVVMIGSTGAALPRRSTMRLAYGVSKGALATATRYLAQELGAQGVTVNNVAPGFKDGPTLQGYFEQTAAAQGVSVGAVTAPLRAELALGRFATDQDVADTIAFFLSDSARTITGQTLYVDGGHVME